MTPASAQAFTRVIGHCVRGVSSTMACARQRRHWLLASLPKAGGNPVCVSSTRGIPA
jgi:hypothetical protein